MSVVTPTSAIAPALGGIASCVDGKEVGAGAPVRVRWEKTAVTKMWGGVVRREECGGTRANGRSADWEKAKG